MENKINKTKLLRQLFIWQHIGVASNATVKEKEIATKEFIDKYPEYNFYQVCETIGLNKGTFYHYLDRISKKTSYEVNDEIISKEVLKVFNEAEGRIGSKKIKFILSNRGIKASIPKVRDLMKKLNIRFQSRKPNRRTKDSTNKDNFYHNLLNRRFFQEKPNSVWVSDFTEIKINGARFYLCVVLDLFSRKVVAYRLSLKLDSNLALLTFKDAFQNRGEPEGLLFHSDRGCQYTSKEFVDTLKALKVKQSFSKIGNPYDNAVMESFFASLKREEIYRRKYKDYDELKLSISNYIDFYNNMRPHKSLNYLTPTKFELQ